MVVTGTQADQHSWVLGFSGKLLFQWRKAYQTAVDQAEAASPRHIIFNFTDLSYIDSVGLGLLTLTHRKLTGAGIKISLAHVQESVKQILLLTNMDKMFPLHDSGAAASSLFKTAGFTSR
jgi:anti-anti-sigma factor